MFQLFVFLLLLFGGCAVGATYGAQYFGTLGLILGLLSGPVIGYGLLTLVLHSWAFSEAVITGMFPYLPVCGRGKCKSGFFDFGDYEPERFRDDWSYFRCKCGRLYQLRLKERRVCEVLDDDTIKPYMIARPFRGWCPEGQK